MRESRSSAPSWNDCAGSGVPAAQAGKYCGGNQGVICKKAGKLSLCRFFGFFVKSFSGQDSEKDLQGNRILVIDDEKMILDTLKTTLTVKGYEVLTARVTEQDKINGLLCGIISYEE